MRGGVFAALLLVAAPAAAEESPVDVFVDADRSPVGERADPTPAAYVLDADDLALPGKTPADALATVPGVQVTRRGGSADLATLSLRGTSNAQTPIYLAGIRLNDELTGTVDLSSLPLWMLDRIEVYRGNAPLSADELGMGGAVLLEPRMPALAGWAGHAALGIGSFGERLGRTALSIGRGGSGALFAVQHRSSDDDYRFVDDNGTRFDEGDDVERRRDNGDFRETDVWAVGRWQWQRGRVAALLSAYDRDGGASGLLLLGAERARASRRRLLGGVSAAYAVTDRWSVALDAGYLSSAYRLSDPGRELGLDGETRTVGERGDGRLRIGYAPSERVELRAGVSHARGLLSVDGSRSVLERATRRLVRGELSAVVEPIDGWHVVVVGAAERHATDALAPAAEPSWYASGRAGTRVRVLDELALFANLGRYVRVPTLGELYGVSAGTLGNPELAAERGLSLDGGASLRAAWRWGAAYAQLAGFVRGAEDLIAYRRSSFGVVRPYNVSSARVAGLELGAGVSLWRTLEVSIALTALDPRDVSDERTTDNDLVPLLARLTVDPRVEIGSPPLRVIELDRAAVGASLAYRSSRATDPAGLVVLDAQARLDLDVALTFAGRLTLRGRIENVIDTQSYDVVGYPLPPRSLHALCEVSL